MKLASLIPLLVACDPSTEIAPPNLVDAPEIMLIGKIQSPGLSQIVAATGEVQQGLQPIVREGDCFLNDNRVANGFPLGNIVMTDPTERMAITMFPGQNGLYSNPRGDTEAAFSVLEIRNTDDGPLGSFESVLQFPAATDARLTAVTSPPNTLDPKVPLVVRRASVDGSLAAVVLLDQQHAALCFGGGEVTVPASVVKTFSRANIWIGDAQLEEQQLGPTDLVTFALQGNTNSFVTHTLTLAQ